MMEFDEWWSLYEDEIIQELENNGSLNEMDFDLEKELELRYEFYLNEQR